jgi:hypothetical protein
MSNTVLEFTVTIHGDDAILEHIHDRLTAGEIGPSALAKSVANAIKQGMVASDIPATLRVELHNERLIIQYGGEKGLSAQAWLETEQLSRHADVEAPDLPEEEDEEGLFSD